MSKKLFALVLCFLSALVFVQAQNPSSELVFNKFKSFYNADKPDSIFAMFSAETKTRLPLERTTIFLAQLKAGYGNIKNAEFAGNNSGFSVYKTQLDKGTILLQLAVNENQAITGIMAKPYTDVATNTLKANLTEMKLPFTGEWTVFWGGDTKEQNYHVAVPFQRNAFDVIITDKNNRSFKTDGKTNEDYYAFGKPINAPCDGEVVLAVDGVKDNIPGQMNQLYVPGNTVIIRTAKNEYVFLAHFKQSTVKVKKGSKVKNGDLLGLCGNSGNSSEPHLHFHIQDNEEPLKATGIKCNFKKVNVNGVIKSDYSPVKGERVSNAVK